MATLSLAQRVGVWISHVRNSTSVLWRFEARVKGASIAAGVTLAGRPVISVAAGSRLTLATGVQLNSAVRSNPLGCFQPCVLRTLAPGAILELGPRVGLSATAIVAAREIQVGEGTIFGAGAMIIDNDFHFPVGDFDWGYGDFSTARPIRIGRGCFIGARAIVLKGVTLGDRAIVGAGAVVTRDVPAGHRAVGNPARILPP